MRSPIPVTFAVTAGTLFVAVIAVTAPLLGDVFGTGAPPVLAAARPRAVHQVSQSSLPLAFERNDGQHPPDFRYSARGAGYVFGLTHMGVQVVLRAAVPAAFSVTFLDGAASPRVSGESPLAGQANYFVGANPSKWRTGIPLFSRVRYENVWPGIDAVFYGNERELEYDVVVAPGADVARARFVLEGVDDVHVTTGGQLALSIGGRDVRYSSPIAYQDINGTRHAVAAEYVLAGHTLSFQVGAYDREHSLVVDPILHFSTYYGSTDIDAIHDVATDAAGNIYAAGFSAALPATFYPGLRDEPGILISKFNRDMTKLRYQVVIAASGRSDSSAIAVDAAGNVYLGGATAAADFPIVNALQPRNQFGGECECDGFVLKLAADGQRLIYSTFLGGNNDDRVTDIAVTPAGDAFVVGATHSPDFLVVNAVDPTYSGGPDFEQPGDGYAVRFSRRGTSVVYSTYLHGMEASSVALDAGNRAYVAGGSSFDLLPTTSNAAQRSRGGDYDGTVVRLAANGAWQYATYLGGPNYDYVQGIVTGSAGNVHAALFSVGGGFPTTANAYQRTAPGGADAVIVTLAPSGGRSYASYYGGTDEDIVWAVNTDSWGRVTLVGNTWGTIPLTADAHQRSEAGSPDVFVATFGGPTLLYATRLGGADADMAFAVAIHQTGRITVAGTTQSANFPVRNAIQNACGPGDGCFDAFIAQLAPRTPGTLPDGSAVVYPAHATSIVLGGRWDPVADPTAAGGVRMENPDAGAPRVATPLANPIDYFDVPATVVPGQPYSLWIRGRAHDNDYDNDSVYVQFSNAVSASGQPLWRTNTTSALTVILEDCINCGLSGWAWQDAGFGLKVAGPVIPSFTHNVVNIRVQAREDGISIDQIALVPASPDAPGFQKEDTTIYPQLLGGGPGEVVLYAGVDGPQLHGAWTVMADSTAAGGARLTHPNAYAAKFPTPLANPAHYVDLTFEAAADTPYFFYLRGKAHANGPYNDSVWIQLSNTQWAPDTTSALAVNLEQCSGVGLSGWGWRDNHWCEPAGDNGGGTVVFTRGGRQTIRIQTREDGISIDQILFSTTRGQPPGSTKDDNTILAR